MNRFVTSLPKPVVILVAEDSALDRFILQQAFDELALNVVLRFVGDGEELLDYLHCRDRFSPVGVAPRPALVLLDLNMPRMDGQAALAAMRADMVLKMIPVVVLSTSDNTRQIAEAYANGVNAFMTKPGPYDDFVALLRRFVEFWLDATKLPCLTALRAQPTLEV